MSPDDRPVTEVYNLRVTVDRIEGRSVCGMAVGDYFEFGTPYGLTGDRGVDLLGTEVLPLLRLKGSVA